MIGTQEIKTLTAQPTISKNRWSKQFKPYLWLLTTDTIAIGLGLAIAYMVRFETSIPFFNQSDPVIDFYRLAFIFIPVCLALFTIFKLYDPHFLFGGTQEYARVFNACTTGMMLISAVSFLYPDRIVARAWLLLSWVCITGLVGVGRFFMRRMVYRMWAKGEFLRATIIVGADEEGLAIASQIASNPSAGVWLAGFIDDNLPKGIEVLPNLRVLGSTDAARALVHNLDVQELVVSSSALSRVKLLELFRIFGNSDAVNVRLSSGLFEIMTTGVRIKEIGHVPLLSVNRMRLTGSDALMKRILDNVGALFGIAVLSPIFLLIAIAIKYSSPGPIFHRRRVVGVGGKEFDAFKFRTMVVNADEVLEQNPELKAEFEKNFKLKDDPRITSIGKILRKTSLDELPQLANVLRGEMSLVGPRMITSEEVAKYGKRRMNLLTVKPGISGLWQVSGRSDVNYTERVRLDMYYIRNYTVWQDIQIIFQTFPALFRKKGAY